MSKLNEAIEAVLQWWDANKNASYGYSIGEYGYDGEVFGDLIPDAEKLFQQLRKVRDEENS